MFATPLDHSPAWLRTGEIVGVGRLPAGSNATFALAIQDGDDQRLAIYKPRKGERQLWDFPDGTLYQREVAAYLASEALGWNLVPPTVVREGPYGVGSAQLYCEPNERLDYWQIRKRRRDELRKLAVFDVITNNADRKGEHCHVDNNGRLWAIDNGLTFHVEFKNRTVLTGFAGDPLPSNVAADLRAISEDGERRAELETALAELLDAEEVDCFFGRLGAVCRAGRVPRVIPHWELYYAGFDE